MLVGCKVLVSNINGDMLLEKGWHPIFYDSIYHHCLNMSWIQYIDVMTSSNMGDKRPVSITDCCMYCLMWDHRHIPWVINRQLTLQMSNDLWIRGKSQLHIIPWMQKTISLGAMLLSSWVHNFQFQPIAIAIGLQMLFVLLILSIFQYLTLVIWHQYLQ